MSQRLSLSYEEKSVRYRKKPVEIDALPVTELMTELLKPNARELVPGWAYEAFESGKLSLTPTLIVVDTLEGVMVGEPGDMIVRGVKGELYPVKPDIFEMTYEAVE